MVVRELIAILERMPREFPVAFNIDGGLEEIQAAHRLLDFVLLSHLPDAPDRDEPGELWNPIDPDMEF